jgi:hypothetical protein
MSVLLGLMRVLCAIYVIGAPILLSVLVFYLLKIMFENIGLLVFIEHILYRLQGRHESYRAFLYMCETDSTQAKSQDNRHAAKWSFRMILFLLGIISCVPSGAISLMSVSTMHAPTIVAYNALVVGSIMPLLFTTILCEMIICITNATMKFRASVNN